MISAGVVIAAIVSNVFSVWLTPQAYREYRDVLDGEAEKGGDNYWTRVRAEQKKKSKPRNISRLNLVSLVFFVIGLSLLLLFALGNVTRREAEMPENSKSNRLTDTNRSGFPLGSRPAEAPVDRVGEVPDGRGVEPPSAPVDQAPPPPKTDD
jgi:hypothetical protein